MTSLDESLHLSGLQVGDGVYVTDVTGCRIKADLGDVSPDSVTLATRRGPRLREGEILKIERQDSVWNGIGIGLGAAALSTRGLLGSGSDSLSAVVGVYGLVFGGGALIGWTLDANIHETVYEAPATSWSFKPLLTTGGAGASMSVGW